MTLRATVLSLAERMGKSAALGLVALSCLLSAQAQGLSQQPTIQDCEQDNVASLAVRACTYMLAGDALEQSERVRVLILRGKAWLTEDDPESAAEDFSLALKMDPHNADALKGRVRALDLLGKFDAAVADWTALIAQAPKDDKLWRSRGASRMGAKDYGAAIADYDTSLTLNPAGLDAYVGRALVYEAMGAKDKALKEFDLGIGVDPNYLLLYWERARMADRWGEKQMAIADYIMVLKINGHWANARKHLERLGVYSPY